MKNALRIIKNTIVCLIVALAVFMMIFTVISVTTFNRTDRNLFGYKAFIVQTDSMSATDFSAGDLIFTKEVDYSTLEEGDIITFMSQNSQSFGQIITHKIRNKTVDAEGQPGFVTYGTTTDTNDETVVTYPFILGKYQGHVPGLGRFFNFLKTPQGYMVCIFVPFMLLIIYQGINCIKLFRRYKKEQLEQFEQERAEIDAERAENAKMLAELQALKAQLEGKTSDNEDNLKEKSEEATQEKATEEVSNETAEATSDETEEETLEPVAEDESKEVEKTEETAKAEETKEAVEETAEDDSKDKTDDKNKE